MHPLLKTDHPSGFHINGILLVHLTINRLINLQKKFMRRPQWMIFSLSAFGMHGTFLFIWLNLFIYHYGDGDIIRQSRVNRTAYRWVFAILLEQMANNMNQYCFLIDEHTQTHTLFFSTYHYSFVNMHSLDAQQCLPQLYSKHR